MQDKLAKVKNEYQAWWEGNNERAVIHCRYTAKDSTDRPVNQCRKDWMTDSPGWVLVQAVERTLQTGDDTAIDAAMDLIEVAQRDVRYAGDGFPSFFLNLGAGCAAAMMSGYFKYYNDTVWFELDESKAWDEILSFDLKSDNRYWETVVRSTKKVAERLKGQFVISNLDLGGNLDILASLRRSEQLLFDVIDEPDKVIKACDLIEQVWGNMHSAIDRIVLEANGGFSTSWMSILSSESYYPSQCDFSAMISPGMFETFVLPYLDKEMARFKKGIYHLDGPGEIPHLDLLCGIKNLHAIQWVPGPLIGFLDETSFALYKRIISKGKKIILSGFPGNAEAFRKLFDSYPRDAFFLTTTADYYEQAMRIIDQKGR